MYFSLSIQFSFRMQMLAGRESSENLLCWDNLLLMTAYFQKLMVQIVLTF